MWQMIRITRETMFLKFGMLVHAFRGHPILLLTPASRFSRLP